MIVVFTYTGTEATIEWIKKLENFLIKYDEFNDDNLVDLSIAGIHKFKSFQLYSTGNPRTQISANFDDKDMEKAFMIEVGT
jgi:hypothetical protein